MSVNISELKEVKIDFNGLLQDIKKGGPTCGNQEMLLIIKGIADNQNIIKKNTDLIAELSNSILLLLKQVNDNQDAIFDNIKTLNKISGIIIEMDKRIKTLEEKHS
jgi:ABC-type transporter Mla subunit MlaD